MKNNIKVVIFSITSFILGLTFVTYAGTYNSEEILYDNSTSGAEAENVKDAIDFLYSHGSCGSGMSCLESPTITINIVGTGNVDKNSIIVPISGSNKIKVTPQNSYILGNIECTNNYQISSYNVSHEEQEIEIINPGVVVGSTCTVRFDAPVEVSVSSTNVHATYKSDTCNSNNSGCICYQIDHDISNFTYGSHTGCNFKSKTCKYTSGSHNGETFDCMYLYWRSGYSNWNSFLNGWDKEGNSQGCVACSGVITCET